ncbi:MAG: TIGR03087 family PEP-CTERM/XrtA system glycosyltransferase [bacterium]
MTESKTPLLFLSHRIPFPPNKGDKIRSWHLLKHLSKRHRVFIGCFIDDEMDWDYLNKVQEVCEGSFFAELKPSWSKLESLKGLFSGQPLTLPYYHNVELAQWVRQIISEHGIRKAVVYSGAMAQYVTDDSLPLDTRVIDFVDVDSDKWRQYAATKKWPMNSIYMRESKKLLDYERNVAKKFSCSLFVSEREAQLFKSLAPESVSKVDSYSNGVDVDYFSPSQALASPYAGDELPIVFTGAMDYWPNVDAVAWFVDSVFPEVKKQFANARFYIVGSNPTSEVMALSKQTGVVVTGRVPDIRPYVINASLAVAPMRIARGVQNKVLEAMALCKPVIVTPEALEGIDASDGLEVMLAETAETFADRACQVLRTVSECSSNELPKFTTVIGDKARAKIVSDFNWELNLQNFDRWLLAGSRRVDRPLKAVS